MSRPAATFSAASVVADMNANSFGFWRQYTDKTITVQGTVMGVYDQGKLAMVRLDGRPKGVSLNEMSSAQGVECYVAADKQADELGTLRTGRPAKLTGAVRKGAMGAIELRDCRVGS